MNNITTLPVLADMLGKIKVNIQNAIPPGANLTYGRVVQIALTQFRKNPALAECDPVSFCSAVKDAATMGLEFGELKHCALVPYGKEVKLMVQYQGWLALLWRSKAITEVQARVVYEGDFFDVEYGSSVSVIHKPAFKSSVPQLYYACATPTGGELMIEVMPIAQVEAHMRQYAKGADKKTSPWVTAFDEMAKKTVLRKLIKLLPLTADSPVLAALKADEAIWESDKNVARLDKFREISSGSDLPSEDDKIVAYKQYSEALSIAQKQKLDLKDYPVAPDKNDVQRLHALTDSIRFKLQGIADTSFEPSTYE